MDAVSAIKHVEELTRTPRALSSTPRLLVRTAGRPADKGSTSCPSSARRRLAVTVLGTLQRPTLTCRPFDGLGLLGAKADTAREVTRLSTRRCPAIKRVEMSPLHCTCPASTPSGALPRSDLPLESPSILIA